ncbi:MAG: hypothetical protein M9932_06945 [Xanthobacteraceae bacterium]|nr:hypothetical protein [Xanthobacteraceae bacterium]
MLLLLVSHLFLRRLERDPRPSAPGLGNSRRPLPINQWRPQNCAFPTEQTDLSRKWTFPAGYLWESINFRHNMLSGRGLENRGKNTFLARLAAAFARLEIARRHKICPSQSWTGPTGYRPTPT